MSAYEAALLRESVAHVLAGGRVCPVYGLPHWVCSTLHLITGVCRTVTTGRFERVSGGFASNADKSGIYRPWIVSRPECPHHPDAQGETYWSTPAASTLDCEQQAIQGGP